MAAVAVLDLTSLSRRAFARMAADGRRVFGERFVALVAYAPASGALFAANVLAEDLDALAALTGPWHHDGLATPLVMTPDEFRRSLDAFPLEYQSILDRHVLIDGVSPFEGAEVRGDDVRRACEIQAKAHLIHLRQGWLEAGGHAGELADLIERSATPLRVLLTNLAKLHGLAVDGDDALAAAAEALTAMPGDLVRAVLSVETSPELGRALQSRLPEYLAASAQLWTFIDRWRAQ